jgi:hypothetical protein
VVAIVQQVTAHATPVTIAATGAGNCLVVAVASQSTVGAGAITAMTLGGAAGNFAVAEEAHGVSGAQHGDAFAWVDQNCAGGQTTVAITGTNLNVAAGSGGIVVYEVSGLSASTVLDRHSPGNAASGTTYDSGSTAATIQAIEFWVGVCAAPSAVQSAGFTGPTTAIGTGGVVGTQITSATGVARYTGTCNTHAWGAVVATFLPNILNVNLALGTEVIAGLAVKANPVNVNLALGTVAVAGLPVTAQVNVGPTLAAGSVIVRGFPVSAKITKNLIIAIASDVGIDPVTGATYQVGYNNFDPADARHFVNIIDQVISAQFPGQANFGGLFFDTPGAYSLISGQNVPGDSEAGVFVFSGNVAGLGGNSLIQLIADQMQLRGASQNIPGPAVAGFPVSGGASTATIVAALNAFYQAIRNLGLIQ